MADSDNDSLSAALTAQPPNAPPVYVQPQGVQAPSLLDSIMGFDRNASNANVVGGQARNGLLSAQTQAAIQAASEKQREATAREAIGPAFTAATGDEKLGGAIGAMAKAGMLKGMEDAANGADNLVKVIGRMRLIDPSNIGTPTGVAAQAAVRGEYPNATQAVSPNYIPTPGMGVPIQPQQTAQGAAQTAEQNALAHENNAKAAAGGFAPHAPGGGLNLDPDQLGALNQAIRDGRLDPNRINSRTAGIFAELERRTPGQTNFNSLSATAAMQRNPTFQNRAMVMESLPGTLQHMRDLGAKLDYSNVSFVGKMQKFMRGELNDPDLTEYMGVRNDALLNLASVMRGQGMSDQAHTAEIEAASPTLAGPALEGWLRGQMSVLGPRLQAVEAVRNNGNTPGVTSASPLVHSIPHPSGPSTPASPALHQSAPGLPPGLTVVN